MNASNDNEDGKQILDAMLRHVVSFAGTYRLKGKPEQERPFNYSCFVVSLNGQWFLVTAGHILEELDPLLKSGELAFTGRVLVDYYGSNATHPQPLPFDYEAHGRVAVHQDGLDFALIALWDLEVKGLQANGVVPFVFDEKEERPWEEYDGFAMVGFPEEDLKSDAGNSGQATLHVQPGLLPVRRLEAPPDNAERTTYPRFVGEVTDPHQPRSIVGMSGGPIIGMKKTANGLEYWVVAIQSHWLKSDRIIFGCPLSVVFDVLNEAAKRLAKSIES